MPNSTVQFFRCPAWFADAELRIRVPDDLRRVLDHIFVDDPIWHYFSDSWLSSSACEELIETLRYERYAAATTDTTLAARTVRELYYLIRPLLGVSLRRHLQRVFLRGWQTRPFPHWPLDRTVDELYEALLAAAMRLKSVDRVPFIWFWPDGHSSCALMTHDVETTTGLAFCSTLMDMDEAAGIKSSFQLIPEQRYTVTDEILRSIRSRGFEINVHDLNHDGHLFRDHSQFRHRAQRINEYGKRFGSSGFRAGALYRNQEWFDALDFEFDMSVPNVAHLDPQHGGCCTLFPYFVGNVLELPVTAIQDYSLFHVLSTYSIELWQKQMSEIVRRHGMINVITHPDYLIEERARSSYTSLLAYMNELRAAYGVWMPTPGEVNTWWRQRAQMKLQWTGEEWAITGPGHERATIAFAEMGPQGITYAKAEPAALRLTVSPAVISQHRMRGKAH